MGSATGEVSSLHDRFFKNGRRKRFIDWLGLDARIDSSIATAWEESKDRYNAFSSFFARFRLSGWRRIGNELVSEALTLGTGGLAVLFVLAIPALNEFDESRITTGRYAVKFVDRTGAEIGQRGILHNDAVELEEIPDHLIKATLATEDRRFFEHFGVDVFGTARALFENARANDVVQGGSTITQQLAKNLFLSFERSLARKIKEAFLALLLEARFTKFEILKMYLDRAYLGGGAFGVEAASQFYFGKSVREINLSEAALLAGLFKAPTRYAPHINMPASLARTNDVLTNLVEAGYMSPGQVHAARLNPARVNEPRQAQSPDWYLDWAFEEVQRIAEGRGHYVLTARVTIDLDMQRSAQEAMVTTLRSTQTRRGAPFSGALVAMDPDGAVRAVVGGIDYGESQFNRATHARRQPGSSFKIYVYATALENGYNPRSMVRDASTSCGNWSPRNYNGSGGSGRSLTVIDAFKNSLNTTAADLSFKVGREKVLEMTRRLGVAGVKRTCSMALGDTGITLLEHTGAYAVFANGGRQARPYAVLELFNSKGELIYSRERDEPQAPQVVSERVVVQMNQMMQAVVNEGTGRRAILDFTHAVGKTGTSSGWRDAWFVGFTGALVTGVWVGHDDFRPMWLNGQGVTGGSLPTTAWHAFMSVAHANRNIPPIQGLPPHPAQVAEQQRLAELKRTDPGLAQAQIAQAAQKKSSIMPDQTRDALKRLADSMLRAGGQQAVPVSAPPSRPDPAPPAAAPTARDPKITPPVEKQGTRRSGASDAGQRGRQ
jgi:penicillin-binding protein 1A